MKKILSLFIFAALCIAPVMADAQVNIKVGPRKGLIMEIPGKNAEFFVEKDRKISIVFYDTAMKPVAVGTEVITAVAEAPSGKTKMEFEKVGDKLVSKSPLPAGDNYQVVMQIKTSADAKPKNFRVKYSSHICGECSNPEYACTCGH